MKKSIQTCLLLATASLLTIETPATVFASSNNTNASNSEVTTKKNTSNTTNLSDSSIQSIDKFIVVNNNQFILSNQGKTSMPTTLVNQVESRLTIVNKAIKDDNLIINPDTKEITRYSPYNIFAASVKGATRLRSGCYVRVFWWGVRVYFTSNAAVNWFRGKISTASGIATVASMVAQVTGHEIAGTLGDAIGMYADSMYNRLYNYNKAHRHSKIYMDINFASIYSFHTFK